MPTTRPDFIEHVQALGLDPEHAAEADARLEVLSRNAGRRQTDRIEVVAKPERDRQSGLYTTHLLVRGIRHQDDAEAAIAGLSRGTILDVVPEPGNPINREAVQVLAGKPPRRIGYVPDYLTSDLTRLRERGVTPRLIVERVNLPPAPVHHRLVCKLEAAWPTDFVPFEADRFQPLASAPASGDPRRQVG